MRARATGPYAVRMGALLFAFPRKIFDCLREKCVLLLEMIVARERYTYIIECQ